MKHKNVQVGQVIEAKRDVRGHCDEFIPQGLQVTVTRTWSTLWDGYPVKVEHPDIEGGYAWVNPKHFRKQK